jgi:RND family efflux transporter MFP subunit
MNKSRIYIGIFGIIFLAVIIWIVIGPKKEKETTLKVPVKFGSFVISVITTGELEAKSSEKIYGPVGLRDFRIWDIKIEDIIPDGTVVDSGEYVASLDRTELVNKLKDQELEVERLETQFIKTQLDTTLQMRTARDNLINLKYALEESQIVVDQSIYEPPATQRQAKIELDRARRNYEQAEQNYEVVLKKAQADMQDVTTQLKKAKSQLDKATELLNQTTIMAPKSGMINYRRGWDGTKQGIGSTISAWDPVVAELPNLKEMKSKTYVNEIDISKVKSGQQVNIGVDAFPDKHYTGVVTEVANIGQQLPNTNAKVFEVVIEVNEFDSILRPAMTTKNEILTATLDSVLYLPLDCIQSNDTMSYVYTSGSKVQVILGPSNENEVVIKEGLKAGDQVYLVPPSSAESYDLVPLEPEVLARIKAEEERARQQAEEKKGPPDGFTMEGPPGQSDKMPKEGNMKVRKGPGPGGKPKR